MDARVFTTVPHKHDIELCITPAGDADISLWREVFGDSCEDVKYALDAFSPCGACVKLKKNGVVVSQFIATEAVLSQKKGVYIYALCTHPSFRGHGFMKELLALSKKQFLNCGYKFFLLLPATETLYDTYKRMGFSLSLPAYASAMPTCERDFYGVGKDKFNAFKKINCQPNIEKLYELSSKIFPCDVFKLCISYILSVADVELFVDNDGDDGFIISCGDNIFLTSKKHEGMIKNTGRVYAQIMPFERGAIFNTKEIPEPIPR